MNNWSGTPTKVETENGFVWGVAILQPKGNAKPKTGDLVEVTDRNGRSWHAVLMERVSSDETLLDSNGQTAKTVMLRHRFVTARADEVQKNNHNGNGNNNGNGNGNGKSGLTYGKKAKNLAKKAVSNMNKPAKAEVPDKILQGAPKKLDDGSWGVIVFYNEQPSLGQQIRIKPMSPKMAPWMATIIKLEQKATKTSCAVCRATAPPKN